MIVHRDRFRESLALWLMLLGACQHPGLDFYSEGLPTGSFTVSGATNPPTSGLVVRALGPKVATTVTDGSGNYSFTDLPAGDYRVVIEDPARFGVPAWGDSRVLVLANVTGRNFRIFLNTAVDASFDGRFLLIHEIQGRTHISPYKDNFVKWVPGIVTGRRLFPTTPTVVELYIQNPWPDRDDRTSEGLYVTTTESATIQVGDFIVIKNGLVEESKLNYPSGSSYNENMTRTQMAVPMADIVTVSTGLTLPEPIVIGPGGRRPPHRAFQSDSETDTLKPDQDMLDFMESLEHMRVSIQDPLTVGHTDEYSVTPIVVDRGRHIRNRTYDGLTLLTPNDFNPEILFLGNNLGFTASFERGTQFEGNIVGIVDYSFRQYKIYPTQAYPDYRTTLNSKVATLVATAGGLTVSGFNVENLAPSTAANGSAQRIQELAALIGNHMFFPDIIGLVEVQDNSGHLDDGTVNADQTLNELTSAVNTLAGNANRWDYDWRQINPIYNAEGGEPGGNIRLAFLFNTKRVTFIDRAPDPVLDPAFAQEISTTRAVRPVNLGGQWVLSHSPGRIDPANPNWTSTRRPLVGEFLFQGHRIFVIANHWSAKGGDNPLHGSIQPPQFPTEAKRVEQARIVAGWIRDFLQKDPNANIIALGDFNDFHWSRPLRELEQAGMTNLVWQFPENKRFSYVYNGNAQTLDHLLVSPNLLRYRPEFEYVHMVTRLPDGRAPTDHEPTLARINFSQGSLATTPPPFIGAFPTVAGRAFRARVQVQLSFPGRVFYVVVPQGNLPPSAEEIRRGLRFGGSPFSGGGFGQYTSGTLTVDAWGLVPDTNYVLYAVTEGDQPMSFGPVVSRPFNTTTLTGRPVASNLFISEVVEGSGNNKAVEIANYTGGSVNLSGWNLVRDNNGNGVWGASFNLSGTIPNGEVFVVARNDADFELVSKANQTAGNVNAFQFNGNDRVALRNGTTVIDVFGFDNSGADFAKDVTFVRSPLVKSPTTSMTVDPRSSPDWIQYPKNYFGDLGRHTYDPEP